MTDYGKLPKTWKWRIKRAGLTQATFAKRLNMSPATISTAINGKSKPTTDTIEKIENSLRMLERDAAKGKIDVIFAEKHA